MSLTSAPRGLAHRLFHSLVISSVIALEGSGCTLSHDPPPAPDGGDGSDAGFAPDAHVWRPDAGQDAGLPDAALPDGGHDAGVPDAGDDIRRCEAGWPTTKGFFCTTQDEIMVCCRTPDEEETCCIPPGEE